MKKSIFLAGLAIIFLGPPPSLQAADETLRTAADQLISQAETFKRESEKSRLPKEEKTEIEVEEEPQAAPADEKGPTFFVAAIRIEGNTQLAEDLVRKTVSPFENRNLTFLELKTLVSELTNLYRSKGYVTSRAYLPPQKINDQTVTIKMLEGRIHKVLVEENRYFKDSLYQDAIHLKRGKIFRYQDLETSLYFLNQSPDRKAKAYLIPGEEPATSDIILKAEDNYYMHGSYQFNNRGTKLTHYSRHTLRLDNNNFSGNGDTMSASLAMTEQGSFMAAAAGYSFPIERTNTALNLGGSVVNSMLAGPFRSAEIKGKFWSLTPGFSQFLIKTPKTQLSFFGNFEIKDSMSLVNDDKTSFDRMRIFKFGPRLIMQDRHGRTVLIPSFQWGIPHIFGGLKDDDSRASRPHSGGSFFYYALTAARLQKLPKSFFLTARASAQISQESLTSTEQFRLGGADTVRGFDESQSSGDYGYNATIELSAPLLFVPRDWKIPISKKSWRDSIRLIGFLDLGETAIVQRSVPTAEKDDFLFGAGFGLRAFLNEYTAVNLDIGFPIGDDSDSDKDQAKLHLDVRAGF